jgi:peptidoglycan hydrolase-like protein with peptidoglycan-binding domain
VICLALTVGTIVNLFGLQGAHRQPLAAIAETFPSADQTSGPLPNSTVAKVTRGSAAGSTRQKQLASDPVGQLLANADADLSVRTADIGRAAADLPAPEAPPSDVGLITDIQRGLADRGYAAGAANGKAGLITRAAIMAFEFDQHFQLTGEPGEETLRRILLGLEGPANQPPLSPGEKAGRIIAGIQRLLQRLGYNPGPVNALLDDDTRKALRLFEADTGLVPKGRIAGDVVAEIARRTHARIEVYDEALSH